MVTYSGETYVCTTSHTSTGAFDATKWAKVAAKGADGSGSTTLATLTDVDVTTGPTNGQALVYNTASSKWKPGTVAGGSSYPLGSADAPPTSANAKDDEFDGTSSVTWSDTPTVAATVSSNSNRPGHLYLRASGSGAAYVGRLQPIPGSYPFTVVSKINGTGRANFHRGGGLVLAPASPSGTSQILYLGNAYNSGLAAERITAQFGGSFVSQSSVIAMGLVPIYLKMVVNSATSVTTYVSTDGWSWRLIESAFNPGFTPGTMGIVVSEESGGGGVDVYADFFRVT